MALRAILGFDHLPQGRNVGVIGTGYGLAYSGYGITITTSDGWAYVDKNAIRLQTTNNIFIAMTLPVAGLSDFVSPRTIMGYRFIFNVQVSGFILTIAGVATSIGEMGITAAGEYYIEVVCDRDAKELSYFVNDVFKLKKSTAVVPIIAGQVIRFETPRTQGYSFLLSDFYFIDDTQDDTPCTRLGSIKVTPLVLNSASAQDWQSSDGKTALEDLSVPYTSVASLTAPTVTSPTTMTPLSVSFAPLTDTEAIIKGVQVLTDSSRFPTSVAQLDTSVTDGTNTVQTGSVTYPSDAFKYGSQSNLLQKAPNGANWGVANLASAKFVFKPKAPT
jgi:hypothetical protein